MKDKWNEIEYGDRSTVVGTLQSAADNIGAFANAEEDPVGAIQGGLNMIAQIASLAGPQGQIISVLLSFVSGFLSLFGAATEEKSVGDIVREQIDEALEEYHDKQLTNSAEGAIDNLEVSKAYVDTLAQLGLTLTVPQAHSLESNIPMGDGLKFMGELASNIRSLVRAKERSGAKKVLKYIELYIKMAVMKDIILLEMVALLPDELEPNRQATLNAQKTLRRQQKNLLKFLYESDVTNIIIAHFDPEIYPLTDAYLSTVLKVRNYDRSLAGTWCLTPNLNGERRVPLTYDTEQSLMVSKGHPYVTLRNDGCFWKLVPHGNDLFTIVNTHNCPDSEYCGQYLSFDIISGHRNRVVVKSQMIFWEIKGGPLQYRCVLI